MRRLLFILFLILPYFAFSQIIELYPYVQATTETTNVIAWRTPVGESSELHYGTDPANLDQVLYDPTVKQIHSFQMTGLTAGTTYYYQVISGVITTAVDHFDTAKPDGMAPFSFLHYGDCGYNNGVQNSIANLMKAEDIDFAVVAGDIDQGNGDNYEEVFFGVYKDLLKEECHFTSIGNHDTYADEAATYLDQFHMPSNNPQNTERYYSFTWGNSKFICLDSNLPYTVGSDQHNWLVDEMQCNDREWLFVFFHHPPYTNAWDLLYYVPFQPYYQYEGNTDMRTDLMPYFEQYGVDYVLNGHSHCYQRGQHNGVYYIISGGAGASTLDMNTNSNAPNIDTELYINQYVRFDVNGDEVTWVCIDPSGNVVDEVIHSKSYTPYAVTETITDASCGGSDGIIALNIVGPKPPYTVSWDNGQSGLNNVGLDAGTYVAMITDGNGCTRAASYTVDQNGGISATTNAVDATCENTNDGAVSIATSGGGSYTYLWSDGSTNSFINGVSAGTYSVTVTSSVGCSLVETLVVNAANIIDSNINTNTGSTNFCEGSSVQLIAAAGYSSYVWSDGQMGQTITVTNPGNYSVIIENGVGCSETSNVISLSQDPLPVGDFSASSNELVATFNASASMNASSYSWDFGDSQTATGVNPSHTYASSGSYNVTLTVTNACGTDIVNQTVIITVSSIIDPSNNPWKINLSPNPFQDFAILEFDYLGNDLSLQILDVDGKIIRDEVLNGQSQIQINRGQLASGVYFYKLTNGLESYIGKMLIK